MARLTWLTLLVLVAMLGIPAAWAADKYVFILKALSTPYWQANKRGIEETMAQAGIKPITLFPANDHQKEEDLNLCQAAIAQQPKIIVMGAATTALGLECYKEAQARGILVADLDATVTLKQAKDKGINLQFSMGADNTKIGEMAAELVGSRFKPTEAPKILLIEGAVGSPPGQDRPQAFTRRIKETLPKAQIINSISGDWDRLKAMNIAADTLARTPDLQVIFAANDQMALGAVEAVRMAHKQGQVMIIGVDGDPDARQAILKGSLSASITQLPYLIGSRSAELAMAAVKGQSFDRTQVTPLMVLTKDVLNAHQDPLLKYVR